MKTHTQLYATAKYAVAAMATMLFFGPGPMAIAKPSLMRTEVVQTKYGPVRGFEKNSVRIFLGIPYAAPPVGALRWRPPHPPAPWHKPLNAVAFGNTCAQTNTLNGFAAPSASEDCLYLNIFAPQSAKQSHGHNGKGLRPVMVWIHGGGLIDGESNDYDGSKLAKDGDTVVVTINYRLNVFGFLSLPSLDAEGHKVANYGLMDQQFALKWVRQNIREFGGDPHNVTIFGESAGGYSVLANMASPTAKGLFQHGIVESGAYALQYDAVDLATAETRGEAFADAVGCPDHTAACLRSLSVQDIETKGAAFMSTATVAVDGTVLTKTIGEAIKSGHFNRVPMINGTNHDEWRWIVGMTEFLTGHVLTAADYPTAVASYYGAAIAPQVLAQYPLADYPSPSEALAAAETDSLMACPARRIDRWASKYVPTYAYQFADETAPNPFPQVSFPYGAAHTLEIQYLFPLYAGASGVPEPLNTAQERLSDDMVSYWTTFARSGNPNSQVTANWPLYQSSQGDFQSLQLPGPVTITTFAAYHHCDFWDSVQ